MRIKLDENVPVALKAMLLVQGHAVDSVYDEGIPGIDDRRLIEVCVEEDRFLITFDLGFGDVRAHPPGQHSGVLVLRLVDQQPAATVNVMRRLLDRHDMESFARALVVVTEQRIRVRRA